MLSLLALLRALSARYLQKRWDRALLIVASIALGVATLVSTRLLNQYIDAASRVTANPLEGTADLSVVTGGRSVKLELADAVRLPGVAAVRPLLVERVLLPEQGGRTAVLLGVPLRLRSFAGQTPTGDALAEAARRDLPPGVSVKFKSAFHALMFATGRAALVGPDLAAALAQRPASQADDPLVIRAGGQPRPVPIAGELVLEGAAARLGGNVLAVEVEAAAKLSGQPGMVHRIDLALEPGADRAAVRGAVEAVLAGQAHVVEPEELNKSTQEVVGGVQVGFTLCGLGALVVGLFLVYNALSVSVAERRHDIGILRSLGATRGQIAGLFTAEASLLGFAGALAGLPLGQWLAELALSQMKTELDAVFLTQTATLGLTADLVVKAVLSGTAVTVLAALLPALQAAADEPADAVRRVPSGGRRFFLVVQTAMSSLLIGGGLTLILARHELPHRVGGFGGMVAVLVGMLLSVPLIVGGLARLLSPLSRVLFGVEARLAADNLIRAPGRTGIVIGALAAGVGLVLQTAGVGKSNEGPVLEWLERAVTADQFVCCGNPTSATAGTMPMEPGIGDAIARLPGVDRVVSIRYTQPDYNDRIVMFTAVDAVAYYETSRAKARASQLPLFTRLAEPGTVLMSENFGALHGKQVGDNVTLPGPRGPVVLRIVGAVPEYSWSRGTLIIDRSHYARMFEDSLIDICWVFLNEDDPAMRTKLRDVARTCGALATAGGGLPLPPTVADAPELPRPAEAVAKFGAKQSLVVFNRNELNGVVADVIRRVYRLAYLQQIVVGIVAALGVVTALLISVLQRRRELGLLRAVGATQWQVLRTVLAEATLMGAFGTFLGLLAGVPLEWYIVRVLIFEESGFLFSITVPWWDTLVISAIAVGLATLAGLLPALHAVRLRIADAVAYE